MIKIEQPDWILIKDLCRNKIIKRYEKYGNSWINCLEDDYWNGRLDREIIELKQTSLQSERINELIDIINICAMQITNHKSYVIT